MEQIRSKNVNVLVGKESEDKHNSIMKGTVEEAVDVSKTLEEEGNVIHSSFLKKRLKRVEPISAPKKKSRIIHEDDTSDEAEEIEEVMLQDGTEGDEAEKEKEKKKQERDKTSEEDGEKEKDGTVDEGREQEKGNKKKENNEKNEAVGNKDNHEKVEEEEEEEEKGDTADEEENENVQEKGDDDEEEEEEEEEYDEMKGFIVDSASEEEEEEDEEDEEDEGGGEKKKKKRKKKKKKYDEFETKSLDEEDLELIAENTGISFMKTDREPKHKRLKRVGYVEEDLDYDDNLNNNKAEDTDVRVSLEAQEYIKQDVSEPKRVHLQLEDTKRGLDSMGVSQSLFNDLGDEQEDIIKRKGETHEVDDDVQDENDYSDENDEFDDSQKRIRNIIKSTFGDVNTVLDIINSSPALKKKKYDDEEDEEDEYEEDHIGKDFYDGEEGNVGLAIERKRKKKVRNDLFYDIITTMERQKRLEEKEDDVFELDKLSKVSDGEKEKKIGKADLEYNLFTGSEEEEEEDEEGMRKTKSGNFEGEVEEEEEEEAEEHEEEERNIMGKQVKSIDAEDDDDGGEDDEYYFDGDEIEQWNEDDETETDVDIEETGVGDDVFSQLDEKDLSGYEEIDEYALEEKGKMKGEMKEGKTESLNPITENCVNENGNKLDFFNNENSGQEDENEWLEEPDSGDFLFEEIVERSKKRSVLVNEKKRWKNFKALDEDKLRQKIEKNSTIKYTDVSEKYYLTYKSRKIKQTKKILFVESKWIILKLKEKYPSYFTVANFEKLIKDTYENTYRIDARDFLSEKFLIKKCMLTLNLLIKYKNEIPFIIFHKSYLIFPPFNSSMLWDIYELDAIWYHTFVKIRKMKKKLKKCTEHYKIHQNVHELLNYYNKLYYDDVYVYYYYIKHIRGGDINTTNLVGESNVLQLNDESIELSKEKGFEESPLKMSCKEVSLDEKKNEKHEDTGIIIFDGKGKNNDPPLLCITDSNENLKKREESIEGTEKEPIGEKVQLLENSFNEEKEEDIFGDGYLSEFKSQKQNGKDEQEREKVETKKDEEQNEEQIEAIMEEKGGRNGKEERETHNWQAEDNKKENEKKTTVITRSRGNKRNVVKYMPTWVFLNYVRKNELNVLDEYLLDVEDFYENISYVFDSIKNENVYHIEDLEKGKEKNAREKPTQDTVDFELELKLYQKDTNVLRTFKYNCSQIKNIVMTVPELYATEETVQIQVEEWIKEYYPRQFAFCKDIFRTLISYYSKILACHPCIRYILRYYFLKYVCLTTVTTAEGEEKIDVGRSDYFSHRLFRFPIYHLLGFNDKNEFSNAMNNENWKRESGGSKPRNNNAQEKVPSMYDMRHDPCYIANYNVLHFNSKLDESNVRLTQKKKELARFYKLYKYKHIYFEILKNKDSKLLDLVIHPALPGERVPWKCEEFGDRETVKRRRKKYEKDIKASFEREKKRFYLSDKLDEEWMNNIIKNLSFAYCYNDLEGNLAFVHLQRKILSNFLQVELLPLFKKNVEQMLYDSAQNWLMTYIYQLFYLTLNVQPLQLSYSKDDEEDDDDYEVQKFPIDISAMKRHGNRNGEEWSFKKEKTERRERAEYKGRENSIDLYSIESMSSISDSSRSYSYRGNKRNVVDKPTRKARVVDDGMDDNEENKEKSRKWKKSYSNTEECSDPVVTDGNHGDMGRAKELEKKTSKGNRQKSKQSDSNSMLKNTTSITLFSTSESDTELEKESSDKNEKTEERRIARRRKVSEDSNSSGENISDEDNFSIMDENGRMQHTDAQDKKKRAALRKLKRTYHVYDVVGIVCESIDDKVKSHIVACDVFGDLLDYVVLDNLYSELLEGETLEEEINKKIKDLETFAVFLKEVQPDIVVVGIQDIKSYNMYYYVKWFIKGYNNQIRVLGESLHFPYTITCGIKISEGLQNRYSREAILCLSLCRFMQNRIYFIVTLFGRKRKELAQIRLHSLQNYIMSYKIKELYTRVVTDIVNKCGCDIVFFSHRKRKMGNILSFISGLGYRKGKEIMKLLLKGGYLYGHSSGDTNLCTRQDLMSLSNNKNLIGKTVYKNCCSFIRLVGPEQDYFDAFDNTRLHPHNCADILLELLGKIVTSKKKQFLNKNDLCEIVNHIIDNKGVIKHMEIKEFANRVLKEKNMYIYPYLKFVQNELMYPYKDYRYEYEGLSEEDMFYTVLNEQRENLKIGSEVVCRICSVSYVKKEIIVDILPYGTKGDIHDARDFLRQLRKYFEQKLELLNSNLDQLMIANRMEILKKTALSGGTGVIANADDSDSLDGDRRKKQEYYEREQKIEELMKKQTGVEFLYESLKGELIKGRIVSVNFNLDEKFESRFQIVVTEDNVKRLKRKYFENSLTYPFGYDNISSLVELDLTCDYNSFIENHFKKLNNGADVDDLELAIDDSSMRGVNEGKDERESKLNKARTQQYQIKKYAHHPNFKVWTSQEGHAYLKQKSVLIGECIICPSNDANTLSLLIKTCDNPFIVAKLTVVEKYDQYNDNLGAVAKKREHDRSGRGREMQQSYFLINNEKYASIDEIISQLCDRLKKNLLEIYKHPKCKKKKSLDQIKKEMYKESLSKPDNIVWSIIPPILPVKNKKGVDKVLSDFNPLRFTLLVMPPYVEQQSSNKCLSENKKEDKRSMNRSTHVNAPKDLIILQDSIYVDHKSFKLWLRSERSLARLICWWKEKGYWNRQSERQAYLDEKRKKLEEYKKTNCTFRGTQKQ